MKSKRIIGFSLAFILIFLLLGLSTVSASSNDEAINNLSDSLESSPISNSLEVIDDIESSGDTVSESIGDSIADSRISNSNDSNEEILNENTGSESIIGDNAKTVHTITEANYSSYFDSDGNLINSEVKAKDTIN